MSLFPFSYDSSYIILEVSKHSQEWNKSFQEKKIQVVLK